MANVLHTDSISSNLLYALNASLPSPAITTTQQRCMLVMVLDIGSTSNAFPPDIGAITGASLTWTQVTLQHELQSTNTAEILVYYTITNKLLSGQVFQVGTQNTQANGYTMAIAQVTGWAEGAGSPSWNINGIANYFNATVATAADVGTVAPPYTVNLRFGSTAWCRGGTTPTFNATGWTSMSTPGSSLPQSTTGYILSSSTTGYKSGGTANAWIATEVSLKMAGVFGTVTTNLTKVNLSLAGTVDTGETGTIATHLSGLQQSASGTVSPVGTIATRLPAMSQLAQGQAASNVGTIVTSLFGISQLAQDIETISGSVVTQLDGIRLQAQAVEVFTGDIVTHLQPMTMSLQAQEIFAAQALTRLLGFSQTLAGEELIEGSVYTALGRAGVLMTTLVEGLEIIQGPIVTNLSKAETHALGGLRAAPGTGKWYSWRSPDS